MTGLPPSNKFIGTDLYTWLKRSIMRKKKCSARTQHIAHQWIWFKTSQFTAPVFWPPHLPTIAFKWKAYAYCYIYILCTVHLLESPNVVFQKMTVTVIGGSQCFIQHLQHQVSTVFFTQNFKHIMVTGITIWWNVLRQLNEQINNRTPGFLLFMSLTD